MLEILVFNYVVDVKTCKDYFSIPISILSLNLLFLQHGLTMLGSDYALVLVGSSLCIKLVNFLLSGFFEVGPAEK